MIRIPQVGECERLKEMLKKAKDSGTTKRIQCILLLFEENLTSEKIASIVGYEPESVRRVWGKYFKNGYDSLISKPKGGRRRGFLTQQEEIEFLKGMEARAETGELTDIAEIKKNTKRKSVLK